MDRLPTLYEGWMLARRAARFADYGWFPLEDAVLLVGFRGWPIQTSTCTPLADSILLSRLYASRG